MSQIDTLAAPVVPTQEDDKWHREKSAFFRLLPDLLKSHKGLFVAIHGGQVVEAGPDKLEVGGRAYARFGYVPIFVTLVSDAPITPVRIPSPRSLSSEKLT
jgi:hypothetical protein